MKWAKTIRETGLLEHVCAHGVGHPDIASACRVAKSFGSNDIDDIHAWLIHGCCSCCRTACFPGRGKLIPLTQGLHAVVDEEDFRGLNQYKWCAHFQPPTNSYRAVRSVRVSGHKRSVPMHRVIMDLEYGDRRMIDHINHDTLDNRRQNLRITDHRGNAENQRNQSKYGVGVTVCRGRFQARVGVNGKSVHIGMFSTPEEARIARAKFIRDLDKDEVLHD